MPAVSQYPHIRDLATCPNCREPKGTGLIVCWPCNHSQKRHNDGMYSKRLETKLATIERALEDATRTS